MGLMVCSLGAYSWHQRTQYAKDLEAVRGPAIVRKEAADTSAAPLQPLPPAMKRAQLEAIYDAETSGGWSDGARQALLARIQAVVPAGSSVLRCECRTSMCRIETQHAGLSQYRAFSRAAFMRRETMLMNRPGFTFSDHPSPDGTLVAVAFLATEGHELPADP
jgi:hypothetical protein